MQLRTQTANSDSLHGQSVLAIQKIWDSHIKLGTELQTCPTEHVLCLLNGCSGEG